MDNASPEPSAASANTVSLHLPGSYRYLALVRDTAVDMARDLGFDEFSAGQIEMAIDESCTNGIEHSYGGECSLETEPDHPGIIVRFMPQNNGMVVEISDFGTGFDYQQDRIVGPQEYIDNQNERGLGLFIISQFVDDVRYERGSDSSNTMRLTKRL